MTIEEVIPMDAEKTAPFLGRRISSDPPGLPGVV